MTHTYSSKERKSMLYFFKILGTIDVIILILTFIISLKNLLALKKYSILLNTKFPIVLNIILPIIPFLWLLIIRRKYIQIKNEGEKHEKTKKNKN